MNTKGSTIMLELVKRIRHGLDVLLVDRFAPVAGNCAVELTADGQPFVACMADTSHEREPEFPKLVSRDEVPHDHQCVRCGQMVHGHEYGPYETPDDAYLARQLGMTVEQLRAEREEDDRLARQYSAQLIDDED